MHHLHFNHWAILVAAVYQWSLGALWYGLLFNKPWMALTGHKKGDSSKGAAVAMAASFIGGLILAFVLAHVVMWSGAERFGGGAFVAFICWLGFVAAPLFSEKMYEQRPVGLFAINSGYWLAAMVVSGGVLAVWH